MTIPILIALLADVVVVVGALDLPPPPQPAASTASATAVPTAAPAVIRFALIATFR